MELLLPIPEPVSESTQNEKKEEEEDGQNKEQKRVDDVKKMLIQMALSENQGNSSAASDCIEFASKSSFNSHIKDMTLKDYMNMDKYYFPTSTGLITLQQPQCGVFSDTILWNFLKATFVGENPVVETVRKAMAEFSQDLEPLTMKRLQQAKHINGRPVISGMPSDIVKAAAAFLKYKFFEQNCENEMAKNILYNDRQSMMKVLDITSFNEGELSDFLEKIQISNRHHESIMSEFKTNPGCTLRVLDAFVKNCFSKDLASYELANALENRVVKGSVKDYNPENVKPEPKPDVPVNGDKPFKTKFWVRLETDARRVQDYLCKLAEVGGIPDEAKALLIQSFTAIQEAFNDPALVEIFTTQQEPKGILYQSAEKKEEYLMTCLSHAFIITLSFHKIFDDETGVLAASLREMISLMCTLLNKK